MRERHFSQAQIIHVSRDRGRRCPVSDSLLVASRNEERERERKDNVFGSRRDIYQLCTLPERKTKRIYSIHLSFERLIAAHNIPRAGEDRGGGPFEKTFVKVCGGYLRDRLSFFFPLPLEFNQEINPGGRTLHLEIERRGHRRKRHCSLDRDRTFLRVLEKIRKIPPLERVSFQIFNIREV